MSFLPKSTFQDTFQAKFKPRVWLTSRVHLRVVPKELKCKHCGELFTNWKGFHDHNVELHNEVPEAGEDYDQYLIDSDFDNHQCEQCGLKFQQKSHLRY